MGVARGLGPLKAKGGAWPGQAFFVAPRTEAACQGAVVTAIARAKEAPKTRLRTAEVFIEGTVGVGTSLGNDGGAGAPRRGGGPTTAAYVCRGALG